MLLYLLVSNSRVLYYFIILVGYRIYGFFLWHVHSSRKPQSVAQDGRAVSTQHDSRADCTTKNKEKTQQELHGPLSCTLL